MRLPERTVSAAETVVTRPVSVSNEPSRITLALWPTEKFAASSAAKGTRSVSSELSRTTATVWPAETTSPAFTFSSATTPESGLFT